jgi:hypothetical protein
MNGCANGSTELAKVSLASLASVEPHVGGRRRCRDYRIMLGDIFLARGVAQLDSEEGDGEWTVFNKDSGGCIRWTIRNSPRDGSRIS